MYQLIILITTANFPDVMLYAYKVNWFYSLYFLAYLLFGLYFLLNLLLAKVFTNYKKSLEEKADQREKNRRKLLEKCFDILDTEGTGTLNLQKSKIFLKKVLNLNYRREKDQLTFKRIMKMVDPENKNILKRERILDYFSIQGFLNVARIEGITR
jgi:hypothetical protein